MKEVKVSADALMSLILSSIEVYSRETFGLLLGTKKNNAFKVIRAVPYLSAERDYEYTSIDPLREKRINSVLAFLTPQRIIGDYHSHPNGPEVLSRHDKKELTEMGDGHLAMLVIVHKIKPPQKNRRWKNNQNDLSICGPIAEKYFVKIFSFVYDKGQEKLIKLRTRSSSINTFNKKIKKYKQVQVKLHSIEKRMRETLKKVQKLKRAKEVL